MDRMSWFTIFWIVWGAVGFCVEVLALIQLYQGSPGGTLSEHVWSLRGTGFHSLVIAALIWTIYHFVFEGRGR